jgi:hypothetical protein
MPLVLTTNEVSASGHTYADVLGVSYEFPGRLYSRLVLPGEPVVFYRGSRGAQGRRLPDYLGSAIVGPISQGSAAQLLRCEIVDYRPFIKSVPFRDESGSPYEVGGSVGGRFYQRGVRRISYAEYARIMQAASELTPAAIPELKGNVPTYGSSVALIRAVDDYALAASAAYLRTRLPGHGIHSQPRNNPGFDISVTDAEGSLITFVEVKGTQANAPVFFLSEGERSFATRMGDRYLWICVFRIQLSLQRHDIWTHVGPLESARCVLQPYQWRCTADGEQAPRHPPP